MKIGVKLILGFVGVALLVGIVGFTGYNSNGKILENVEIITKTETPALIKLSEMRSTFLKGVKEVYAYPLLNDPNEKEKFYGKMGEFDILAGEFESIARIGQAGQEEESELFNKIVANKKDLVISANNVFELYEKNGKVGVQAIEVFESEINTLIPLFDQFIEIESSEVVEEYRSIENIVATSNRTIIIVTLITLLLALNLGFFISRSISKPIEQLSKATKEISRGKFKTRVNIKKGDELGELGNAYNKMAKDLSKYQKKSIKVAASRERTKILGETKEKLVKEVKEKTRELDLKIKDLKESKMATLNILEDIEAVNKQLKELDKMKSGLIRDVSHELKSPLVTLYSSMELLKKEQNKGKIEEINKMVEKNINRLKTTIDSILNVGIIEANQMKYKKEKVQMNGLIKETTDELKLLAEKKNLQLKTNVRENLPLIVGDKQAIGRALTNLIDNSIKYTKQGSIVINAENKSNKL